MSTKVIRNYKGYQGKKTNIRHNTSLISVNCPKCLTNSSTPGRKKTFKNLASLDSHFSTEHKGEFWIKEAQVLIRQFAEVVIK